MLAAGKILRKALPLIALLLAVDTLFSIFATCDQISHYPRHNYSAEKFCTAFAGPLIGNTWRIFVWVAHILHKYDKEIVALFTAILTVSTIALWWSTRKLWIANENQFDLARDEFNSTHRPKIRLKHLWLTADMLEGNGVEATAVFVNAGLTPAVLLEMNIGTCIIDSERMLPENPNWIKNRTLSLNRHAPLGAGISLEIQGLNDGRVLKAFEHVRIREGKARLYFAGAIEYRDQRDVIRKTAFCRVLKPPGIAHPDERGRFILADDSDYEYDD